MKRVITLDVLRGIAIFMVILTHVFIKIIDMNIFNLDTTPIYVLVLLAPLIFLGKWKTFFLLISTAAHIYSMSISLQKSTSSVVVLLRNLLNSLLLLVIAYFFKIILLPNAALDQYIFTGEWAPEQHYNAVMFSDTLEIIAICRIINSLFYFALTRFRGLEKKYRNIIIFGVLVLASVFSTKHIVDLVFQKSGFTPYNIRSGSGIDTWVERCPRMFLALLIGWQEPLFPFISSAFAGAILGIIFTFESLPRKKFMRWGVLISILVIILGACLSPFTEDIIADIRSHIHAPWLIFVNLGTQFLVVLLFIRLIEFNPNNKKIIKRLRYFRRFGMVSLSLFCFELVDLIPRWAFSEIFEDDFIHSRTDRIGVLLGLVAVTIILWSLIIRLWEFIKFYGTMESMIKIISSLIQGKLWKFKDPLNVNEILYNAEAVVLDQDQ